MTLSVDADWRTRANCLDVDPDIMHPAWDAVEVERAKRVCRRCPVKAECLGEALRNAEQHGVWGGKTPAERSMYASGELVHPRRKADCPKCGRPIVVFNGSLRKHNESREPGSVMCPGTGWVP